MESGWGDPLMIMSFRRTPVPSPLSLWASDWAEPPAFLREALSFFEPLALAFLVAIDLFSFGLGEEVNSCETKLLFIKKK